MKNRFEFNGELDERLFRNLGDGEYEYTPFFLYTVAQAASAYFKYRIFKLDANFEWHSSSEKEVIDYVETEKNKEKFAKEFEQFEELWQQYKQDNPSEFQEQERIDSEVADMKDTRVSFRPSRSFNLKECIDGYVVAMSVVEKVKGEYDDYLPKEVVIVSKSEFRDKHKTVREELREKCGIPGDEVLQVKKVEQRPRIKVNRKKLIDIASEDPFEDFTIEFKDEVINQ